MGLKRASGAIARRYAHAVLDVASAASSEGDGPERVRAALESARTLFTAQPELQRALTHPGVVATARQRVVSAVWASAPELVKRLLHLLVERDRLSLLPAITDAYVEAWNEARGVVSAEAVGAVELDAGQEKALREALGKATGKRVELSTRVDPAVLGGLKVMLGGRTFDGTVKVQLGALKRRLRGAA